MKKRNQKALSLVELILAMAMSTILVMAAGVLLLGGSNAFHQMYAATHDPLRQDAIALAAAFKSVGRKSNRTNYTVYEVTGNTFTEAQPDFGQTLAVGQAVEFRFWDAPFYELSQGMAEMDINDTGTHYALFYLKDDELWVDYGEVSDGVGAVQSSTRRTSNIESQCLAHDVDTAANTDIFSHDIIGGAGSGCVTLNVTLENDEGKTVDVKTATLLRVAWPQ